jgi:hypothetical protein
VQPSQEGGAGEHEKGSGRSEAKEGERARAAEQTVEEVEPEPVEQERESRGPGDNQLVLGGKLRELGEQREHCQAEEQSRVEEVPLHSRHRSKGSGFMAGASHACRSAENHNAQLLVVRVRRG